MDLTYKQRLFVVYYIETNGNATEAARRAGYKEHAVTGSRDLLKNPKIRSALAAKVQAAMPKEEVLARLSEIASGSLEYFIDVDGGTHWKLDLVKAKRRGKLRLLKKLKWGESGPEIEIHDPLSALDKLAKIHRLYEQKEDSAADMTNIVTEAKAKADGRKQGRKDK